MYRGYQQRLSSAFQESPPSFVRNVCILAHVDHGKTTLTDFLISANDIISSRLAGKLRYMDSREDEQKRGITMKSSTISLYYEPLLLNLIDSPGHVDFCTEVISAINLADIAILLVDAVEGVCSQTESLIRQALTRNLDIVLVVNKLDRLVVELKMSESEAHHHLQRLIEFVNACMSKAIQGQLMEEDLHTFEQIENQLHFDPVKGNVIFASALYGYAFGVENFAQLWAKQLIGRQNVITKEIHENNDISTDSIEQKILVSLAAQLRQHLFSREHYFSKNGKICTRSEDKKKRELQKPLFEQFVLEPLWKLHQAFIEKDIKGFDKMVSKLGLPELKAKTPAEAFRELIRNWLPLSACIVDACGRCQSAEGAYQQPKWGNIRWSTKRLSKLFPQSTINNINDDTSSELPSTADCLRHCLPDDPLIIAFVAKSLKAVDLENKPRRISLCRVMSGTLKLGDQLFVFKSSTSTTTKLEINSETADSDSNHNINKQEKQQNWRPVCITSLFILLGRELLNVEKVAAGRICGIEVNDGEWIDGAPLLCSRPLNTDETPRLDLCDEQQKFAEPFVRVTIRPKNPGASEIIELRNALRQLAVLDSAVRIMEQENGELAMVTAGEVHLVKCLEDLKDLGQTELVVSEPIVPFLETLVPDIKVPYAKILTDQLTECRIPKFSMRIRLRAVPLWGIELNTHNLVELLQKNASLIESLRDGSCTPTQQVQVEAFRTQLMECASECLPHLKGSWWAKRKDIRKLFSDGILAFGPAKAKFNILFNNNVIADTQEDHDSADEVSTIWKANLRPLEQAMVWGFHLAMAQGPLCDEPMQAVGIVLEEWTVEEEGPELHGQLISATQQACRAALKKHTDALRLLAAMYQCHVQTPEKTLGRVLAVLTQKRAKIHSEEVNEFNGLFEIGARMPLVESFSFCNELRKKSSGTASAQLEFSGWELLDEDPYWEPTTEEEMEEFGRAGDIFEKNQARQYMDAVRRRKGLLTEDVIVVSAEKQRNLKKNK